MAPRDPRRPPTDPGKAPRGADVRSIDYDDDEPTGVAPRQPPTPACARPASKAPTRIDPNDVFYLTDRPLPSRGDATTGRVRSSASPPPRSAPPVDPARPGSVPPPPRLPSVRMPDPRTSTVAFPLANRRTSRPPPGAGAPAATAPVGPEPPRGPRFPPLPEIRKVQLPPPVEARWSSSLIIFAAGLAALILCSVVFAVVVGLYGP